MAEINVGYWSYYEDLGAGNRLFFDPHLGTKENTMRKYCDLYEEGRRRGINIRSLDLINDFDGVDCFLFSDIPRMDNALVRRAFASGKPRLLIIEECQVIRRDNWKAESHEPFDTIFTWNDAFVDNERYFKYNTYFLETRTVGKDLPGKEKLCTMIASNKRALHPLELYSERRRCIRWFEKHHPEDFDLYGVGWDEYAFPHDHPLLGRLNSRRLKSARRLLRERFPSWRGPVARKKSVLEKYRFAIAYENARDIPGYILEKIFDPFFAGTVPIYLGANNVADHIPEDCFIDKRDFSTYEDLYAFLKGMDDATYLRHLDHIEDFLNSEKAHQFSSAYFVNVVIDRIEATLARR